MNNFYITITSTFITSILGFIIGLLNNRFISKRKNSEEQLIKVFTPIIREMETLGIEYDNTKIFVDKIYKIVYENVPYALSSKVISLKDKVLKDESFKVSSSEEWKFINSFTTNAYFKLQKIFRKNMNVNENKYNKYKIITSKIINISLTINSMLFIINVININKPFISNKLVLIIAIFNLVNIIIFTCASEYISKKELEALKLKLQHL